MAAEKQQTKHLVVVGTTNKLKINAIASCYDQNKYIIFGLHKFQSTVSEYPVGKQETYQGSKYRAETAYQQYPDARFWIGVESGFLYHNWQNIPIDKVDIVNVIVSIVILTKNLDSNDMNSKKHKNHSQFNEMCLWSETLKCPITSKQRSNQIANPIKNYLSQRKSKMTDNISNSKNLKLN